MTQQEERKTIERQIMELFRTDELTLKPIKTKELIDTICNEIDLRVKLKLETIKRKAEKIPTGNRSGGYSGTLDIRWEGMREMRTLINQIIDEELEK